MKNKTQSYYSNIRSEMVEFIKSAPSKILEIGCGDGGFRSNFSNEIEYWGVEPCEKAAHKASFILSKTLHGTYDKTESQIPDKYFDLIVCNDVIEHMTDYELFLQSVQSKLTPNGTMIVSIPNIRNATTLYNLIIKGAFDYVEAGVLDYTHYHLFTQKSFIGVATKCGWNVEICKPLPPTPYKPFKNIILNFLRLFIPEIKSNQIGARLCLKSNLSNDIDE